MGDPDPLWPPGCPECQTCRVTSTDAEARIGMSGWVYPPWRGEFYPKGLRQAESWRTRRRT